MRATMMDVPLTVTSLLRYGTASFGEHEVVTWGTQGARRRSYAATGARAPVPSASVSHARYARSVMPP